MNENDKQAEAWPCKIIESDFEQDTITVQMQNKDYFVSGGTFWLSMHKQAEPVAWVRRHPDGALTNEFLENEIIEPVRKNSGAWVPLYTHPPQPVQPADTPEEFNAQSFFSLWSSYCDKKMEIEDLKAVNEHLLEALITASALINGCNMKIDPVREKVAAAIAAADAQIKEQPK